MYISEITHFDADDQEADVYVSDGKYSVLCYLYPAVKPSIGQTISIVFCFGCKNLQKTANKTFRIKKQSSYYAYSVTAQVISSQSVRVGDIIIHIDDIIPADITKGDYISFESLRFDI